jgi:hypothetical protein
MLPWSTRTWNRLALTPRACAFNHVLANNSYLAFPWHVQCAELRFRQTVLTWKRELERYGPNGPLDESELSTSFSPKSIAVRAIVPLIGSDM